MHPKTKYHDIKPNTLVHTHINKFVFLKQTVQSTFNLIVDEKPQITTNQIHVYPIRLGDRGVIIGYEFRPLFPVIKHLTNVLVCANSSYYSVDNIEKSNIPFELLHRINWKDCAESCGIAVLGIAFGATMIVVVPDSDFHDKIVA